MGIFCNVYTWVKLILVVKITIPKAFSFFKVSLFIIMLEIDWFKEFENSIAEEKHSICEGWGEGSVCARKICNNDKAMGLNNRVFWRLDRMQRNILNSLLGKHLSFQLLQNNSWSVRWCVSQWVVKSCSNDVSTTYLPYIWDKDLLTCLAMISGQHKKNNPTAWIAQYYRYTGKVHSRSVSVIPQSETRTTTSALECRKSDITMLLKACWKMFKSFNLLCLVQSYRDRIQGKFWSIF